ncbi:secretin [Marinobacter piscensis]|uniref:secretin n=1 Tax=Marinobacter piscensis TaxID=1562308 RepID=UPI0011A0F58E|nr:secretin [Marinobacter piscensis]
MRLNPRHPVVLPCVFILLFIISSTSFAQAKSRAFQLDNRPGADVAEQIRALYQNEPVSMTARGQQLVVRGEPLLLDEIGTLIETLDVAPVQLRITVRSARNVGGKRSGGGVTASGKGADVTIKRRVTTTNNAMERSLRVMDGQSAHITSGQVRTLPFALQGGRNPAAIFERIETRSGFVVSPQVISDHAVELSIMSFEADPAELEGYETQAMVTIRRVEPGQWVPLGSTSTQSAREQSEITYRVESSRSDNRSFEVKVDIIR